MPRRPTVPSIASEFSAADLGDERLSKRLVRVASTAAESPGESFPRMVGSEGELEGVYRFLSNSRVSLDDILRPHVDATRGRCAGGETLVLHDTTSFTFRGGGHRKGLGRLQRSGPQSQQGFFGHFALAVSGDGSRTPLGVVGVKTFTRAEYGAHKPTRKEYQRRKDKESARWMQLVTEAEQVVPGAIHVMDREADAYQHHRLLLESGMRFVIRGRTGWPRIGENLWGLQGLLQDLVNKSPLRLKRQVRLTRRKPTKVGVLNRRNAPRDERTVTLAIRAARIALPWPAKFSRRDPARGPVWVNIVVVEEVAPPSGVEPVSWMLLTSEAIATPADIEKVVDAYRARWTIEEFFKSLKTGCAFEKRQLESLAALQNALAVFTVIAWRLLLLRTVARTKPDSPASTVATARQIAVIEALPQVDVRFRDIDLRRRPQASEVLLAIAKIGGHLKRNGEPGWQVLGRGYDALLLLELGWMAREKM